MAQELEMKILTSDEEFSRCRSVLQRHTEASGESYVQVNYYFDTPDSALASAHSMLRVRRKKDSLYLQFKNKRKRQGALFLCDEWEAELTAFPQKVNPSRYFPDAPDQECFLLGDLVTLRTDFVFPQAVVSLDENIYFGVRDLEIEIEGTEEGIATVAAFLNPEGESQKGNGKFSRFMKEYQRYKGDAL